MKRLLRDKANFVVLEGFLSELLQDNIKIHRILESEGNKEDESDKFNRVDVLAENNKLRGISPDGSITEERGREIRISCQRKYQFVLHEQCLDLIPQLRDQ